MTMPAAKQEMRDAGFALMQRLYMSPQPIIMACEGHAVAGGAVLLLTADERIGIQGDHKLGLNEVAIGMPLPVAIIELGTRPPHPGGIVSGNPIVADLQSRGGGPRWLPRSGRSTARPRCSRCSARRKPA